MTKIALVTGVTGQDGSYLTRFLLERDYKVVGVKRRTSLINTDRINECFEHPCFELRYGNLHDGVSLTRLIHEVQPD